MLVRVAKARATWKTLCSAIFCACVASTGSGATDIGLGSSGLLYTKAPPCVREDPATALERCAPAATTAGEPDDVRIENLSRRVQVLLALGRWDDAQVEVNAELAARPSSAPAHHFAARLTVTKYKARILPEMLAAAKMHIAAAVSLAPRDPDVLATRAFIIGAAGHTQDAIAAYAEAIALSPGHLAALRGRAWLFVAAGRPDLALKDFDKAVEVHPDDTPARYGRGKLLIELKRHHQAIADLDYLIEKGPQAAGTEVYMLRAAAHQALGSTVAAYEDLTTILYGPKGGVPYAAVGGAMLSDVLMRRALVLADLNRQSEAAEDALKAIQRGGKPQILKLQIFLRQNGFASIPIDGEVSPQLISAIENCFRDNVCRRSISNRT